MRENAPDWKLVDGDALARFQSLVEGGETGLFCVQCGAPGTTAIRGNRGEAFACPEGHYESRCLRWDDKYQVILLPAGLVHDVAVLICTDSDGKTLLVRRSEFPWGWSLPRRHLPGAVAAHPTTAAESPGTGTGKAADSPGTGTGTAESPGTPEDALAEESPGTVLVGGWGAVSGDSRELPGLSRWGSDRQRWHVAHGRLEAGAEPPPEFLGEDADRWSWQNAAQIAGLAAAGLLVTPTKEILAGA